MLSLFTRFELGKISKFFRTKKVAKIITISLFLVVFLFVGVGIYGFFVSGFKYVNVIFEPEFKLPLLLFIYEFFLIILAFVIVLSAMVSGLFNLFRKDNNNWIISSPAYKLFPKIVSLRSLFTSALPLFILFLPMILAFTKIFTLEFSSLLLILCSIILLLLLLNSLTLSIIVVIGYLYYLLAQRIKSLYFTFSGLIATLIVIITLVGILVWRAIENVDLVKMFKADDADAIVSLSNIGSHFTLLPTHPFALLIVNLQSGLLGTALFNFGILLVLTIVSSLLWWKISVLYYPLWQKFQEGTRKIDSKDGISVRNSLPYTFSGSMTMALFKKEALVLSRNFKGALWFFFLMLIWIMEIGTNSILGHNLYRYESDISQQINILQTFQFIIAVYFISTFTLRFVFPSFSVEKKTSWILGTAPLNFKKIFFGKYVFYTSFFVIIGIIMSYINIAILNVPFMYALYSMLLFVSVIIFIVTLGLCLGALFPNRETDDPEIISTSISGLFFTAFSLLYGALSTWVLYSTLTTSSILPITTLIITTLLFIGVLLLQVPKRIKYIQN